MHGAFGSGVDAANDVLSAMKAGPASHWRDRHFADAPSTSLLMHLLKVEGGAAESIESLAHMRTTYGSQETHWPRRHSASPSLVPRPGQQQDHAAGGGGGGGRPPARSCLWDDRPA